MKTKASQTSIVMARLPAQEAAGEPIAVAIEAAAEAVPEAVDAGVPVVDAVDAAAEATAVAAEDTKVWLALS